MQRNFAKQRAGRRRRHRRDHIPVAPLYRTLLRQSDKYAIPISRHAHELGQIRVQTVVCSSRIGKGRRPPNLPTRHGTSLVRRSEAPTQSAVNRESCWLWRSGRHGGPDPGSCGRGACHEDEKEGHCEDKYMFKSKLPNLAVGVEYQMTQPLYRNWNLHKITERGMVAHRSTQQVDRKSSASEYSMV